MNCSGALTVTRKQFRALRTHLLIYCGLGLLILAVYVPVAGFDFVGIDDPGYVTNNGFVQRGLDRANVAWAFTTTAQGNWHPLTWLSLMLDAQLGGTQSGRLFHLTNLALHLANALLMFHVLWRMTRRTWRSAFVAALFAVHPLHVESVAWIAERKDVLSTLFWLLTMLAYVRYVERPGGARYGLLLLVYSAGLLSKPMLVTLPLLLLLVDYWPLGRFDGTRAWPKLALEKLPLLLLAAASSAATLFAQTAGGAVAQLEQFPLGTRVANALVAYVAYLYKTIWPTSLALPYPYPYHSLTPFNVIFSVVILLGISVGVIRFARQRPYLPVGWLWYVVSLLPVIGLIQVGSQAMADRYTYVPLTGLFVIVAWGVPDLLGDDAARALGRRVVLAVAGVAAVLGLAGLARVQVGYWRDSVTLFSHALEVTERNPMAHYGLAIDAYKRGRLERAESQHRQALRLHPTYVEAHTGLAAVLFKQQRYDQAESAYREALRLRRNDPLIRCGLGEALLKQQRLEEAAEQFEEALRTSTGDPTIYNRLGDVRARQERFDEALVQYRAALELDSSHVGARSSLATILMMRGQDDLAAEQFEQVLRLDPNKATAHNNLGLILFRRGRLEQAIAHFEAALRTDPSNAGAAQNLARSRAQLSASDP
jgi:tetratricopeptide (TPR) repeat protein